MRSFRRLDAPPFLGEVWEAWGQEWKERYEKAAAEGRRAAFNWRQIDNTPVNQLLLPVLSAQTQEHCSFCDAFPMSPPSTETVEHFKPKTQFHSEAYKWENLYYCCNSCQQKGEEFDNDLIRPDSESFDFNAYFIWNFVDGTLEVNPNGTPDQRRQAEVTIRIYRLNKGHPRWRKLQMRRRLASPDDPVDEFAYRGYIDYSRSTAVPPSSPPSTAAPTVVSPSTPPAA